MDYPNNDSAISISTIPPTPYIPTTSANQDASSLHSASPGIPYNQLTPAQQAAQDVENNAAIHQAQNQIDIDSEESESGYETDSLGSSSTSLSSSARNYAWENGRRYHRFREGIYNFPNDDREQEREDMKHAMMVNLCQKLHFAPLGNHTQEIMDIGTGTGIWSIEMGDLYPGANILGVDLSPIQPEWVPQNVRFMVDDVESPWLRPQNHYDYIHGRHITPAMRDWPKLLQSIYNHLKPGGWYEAQEVHHRPQSHDNSIPPNHPVTEYWSHIATGLKALGVDCDVTLRLADMMRDAGFVNVTTRIFHVPIGVWPRNQVLKMVGNYWRAILLEGLEPIALGPMTRGLKWSKQEVDVWLTEVRKAYMDSSVHGHMPLYIICGQKPE